MRALRLTLALLGTLLPLGGAPAAQAQVRAQEAPVLVIDDAVVTEGPNAKARFKVKLIDPSTNQEVAHSQDVSFRFLTSDDTNNPTTTAKAGEDYTPVPCCGTFHTIPAGQSSILVDVDILDDNVTEGPETFLAAAQLDFMQGTGGVRDSIAVGTILDKSNAVPTVSIEDGRVLEGDSGTAQMIFIVRLAAKSRQDVTVSYETRETGSAEAGEDFVPVTNGALTIPKSDQDRGTLVGRIVVTINRDRKDEPDETFQVKLTGARGATIADGEAIGTIRDDDAAGPPLPKISISRRAPVVREGTATRDGSGRVVAVPANTLRFEVVIQPALKAGQTASVVFRTGTGGTAAPGEDFRAVTQRLTFPNPNRGPNDSPNVLVVSVPIFADDDDEPDRETVQVLLSGATNATIDRGEAFGTILDDDETVLKLSPAPGQKLDRGAVVVREGDTDATGQHRDCKVRAGKIENCAVVIAELNKPARKRVTAKLQVGGATGDTAANGTDFDGSGVKGSGVGGKEDDGRFTVEFAPGKRFAVIGIRIVQDDAPEPAERGRRTETFTVSLSDAVGATIRGKRSDVGVNIEDDDALPPPTDGGLFILANGQAVRIGAAETVKGPRGHLVARFPLTSSLISQDGGSVYAASSASFLLSHGVGVSGNEAAGVISNDGNSLISQDGASLISQDGGSLTLAKLISQDGGSLVPLAAQLSQHLAAIQAAGASLISQDGASLVDANAGAKLAAQSVSFSGNVTSVVSPRFGNESGGRRSEHR